MRVFSLLSLLLLAGLPCACRASAPMEAASPSSPEESREAGEDNPVTGFWLYFKKGREFSREFRNPVVFWEVVPRKDLDHWIIEALNKGCVRAPECEGPFPLVAYKFSDDPVELLHRNKGVPYYVGIKTLMERDGRLQYFWEEREKWEPFLPDVKIRSEKPLHVPPPHYLSDSFELFECEFAYGESCGAFFFHLNKEVEDNPHTFFFFTVGRPPDYAWVPEFDSEIPPSVVEAAKNPGRVIPYEHPRLKNPLPGMRPAPWQPPALKAE